MRAEIEDASTDELETMIVQDDILISCLNDTLNTIFDNIERFRTELKRKQTTLGEDDTKVHITMAMVAELAATGTKKTILKMEHATIDELELLVIQEDMYREGMEDT